MTMLFESADPEFGRCVLADHRSICPHHKDPARSPHRELDLPRSSGNPHCLAGLLNERTWVVHVADDIDCNGPAGHVEFVAILERNVRYGIHRWSSGWMLRTIRPSARQLPQLVQGDALRLEARICSRDSPVRFEHSVPALPCWSPRSARPERSAGQAALAAPCAPIRG